MRKTITVLLSLLLVGLTACDEGDIQEKSSSYQSAGRVVKMTGAIANLDTWPSGYEVVVAVFNENDKGGYYKTAKMVPTTYDGSAFVYHLSDVIGDYTDIRLCVVNSIHSPVYNIDTIYTSGDALAGDTIYYDASGKDAGMWKAVTEVFAKESCTQCHSSSAAAGKLGLKAEDAYAQLVNVPSNHYPTTYTRVTPGNAETSLLYKALTDESILGYNHVSHITTKKHEYEVRSLIRDWINSGASNK